MFRWWRNKRGEEDRIEKQKERIKMKSFVLLVLACLLLAGCASLRGKGTSSVNADYRPFAGYETGGQLGTGMVAPAE